MDEPTEDALCAALSALLDLRNDWPWRETTGAEAIPKIVALLPDATLDDFVSLTDDDRSSAGPEEETP